MLKVKPLQCKLFSLTKTKNVPKRVKIAQKSGDQLRE